jgi:GcrA cell cycle regulator
MPAAAIAWSDDRIEMLVKCRADGLSARQTAVEMGFITRNAVLGKVHRLGLAMPDRPIQPRKKRHQPYKPRPKTTPPKYSECIEVVRLRCSEIAPRNLMLVDLEPGDCRYPINDSSPYIFCGHEQLEGSKYCRQHTALSRRGNGS